jgi:hypothetical protein
VPTPLASCRFRWIKLGIKFLALQQVFGRAVKLFYKPLKCPAFLLCFSVLLGRSARCS